MLIWAADVLKQDRHFCTRLCTLMWHQTWLKTWVCLGIFVVFVPASVTMFTVWLQVAWFWPLHQKNHQKQFSGRKFPGCLLGLRRCRVRRCWRRRLQIHVLPAHHWMIRGAIWCSRKINIEIYEASALQRSKTEATAGGVMATEQCWWYPMSIIVVIVWRSCVSFVLICNQRQIVRLAVTVLIKLELIPVIVSTFSC